MILVSQPHRYDDIGRARAVSEQRSLVRRVHRRRSRRIEARPIPRHHTIEREGETVKKFLMLHYGYEEPTAEIMAA